MAENGKYLIGESLREKLKSTIARVDALAPGGPEIRIPTAHQGMPGVSSQKVFRVCTFTGSWAINATKAVTFKGVTATPNTVSVSNLFFPVTSTATTTKDCAIAKDGTAWYLIAVPLSTSTAVFVGSTTSGISISSTATSTFITDIMLSATLNSTDCAITINKTLTTSSGIAIKATATSTLILTTFTSTFIRIG